MLVAFPERGRVMPVAPLLRRFCLLCGAPIVARPDEGCTVGRCAGEAAGGPDAGDIALNREMLSGYLFETEIALAALEAVIAIRRARRWPVARYLECKIWLTYRRTVLRSYVETRCTSALAE